MNPDEIGREIEKIENNVEKVARGDDGKFIAGLIARGVWEVARQLSLLRDDLANRNDVLDQRLRG